MATTRKTTTKKPHPLQRVREDVEAQAGIFPVPPPPPDEDGAGDGDGNGANGAVGAGGAAGAAEEAQEALIWILVDGPVLGDVTGPAGSLLEQAGPLLRDALKDLPFLPGTLTVNSEELASALRGQISSRVELKHGATPELDEVAEEILAGEGEPPSYLGAGADEKKVASFFAAAAKLYRAQPWKSISADHLIGVTIEELDMRDEVLAVIAPSRGSKPGFILANDVQELDDYGEALERDDEGEEVTFPPIQLLVFEPKADLLPELVEEIATHGWEIAGPKACPYVATLGPDGLFEDPQEQDYAIGEALAKALAELVSHAGPLKKALGGDSPPLVIETTVDLHGDPIKVVLTAPFRDQEAPVERPEHPILASLYDLEGEETIDKTERHKLEAALLKQFKASAAGENFKNPQWLQKILDVAAEQLGTTAASLVAPALEDVLFELLPRQSKIDPKHAEAIVAECNAFFQFLAADCNHEHAFGCIQLLEIDDVVEDLQAALEDPDVFADGDPATPPPPAPEKTRGPSPAERNKAKSSGPPKGSSRRGR